MIYGITGPRNFGEAEYNNYDYIAEVLDGYKSDISSAIFGGGRGVEELSKRWAIERRVPYQIVRPDFSNGIDKKVFEQRNVIFIDMCDRLLVFWDAKMFSATMYFICKAVEMNKIVLVVPMR